MPVAYAVSHDHALFIVRYYDRVTTRDAIDNIRRLAEEAGIGGTYRVLLLFDRMVDLSAMDAEALNTIRREELAQLGRLRLRRRAGAAVVDDSLDAKIIMPLWNAICESDRASELQFRLFTEVEPALDWLEIPRAAGLALVAAAEP